MTAKPSQVTQGLRGRLFSGLRWTGASQIFQQVINLAWSISMAHLLPPADFGLLAMASVFTGIVYFVLDLGLGAVVVQHKNLTDQHLSSIFWLNVFVGLLMTLVCMAFSGPIAWFYNQPIVQPLVILLACNFLLYSLSLTQSALLTRNMDFRTLGLRTLGGLLVGSVVSVAMAAYGLGIWSLVGRVLITSLIGIILLWSVSGWRPSWHFRWADVREFIGFSSEVLVSSLLGHVGRNADNLLIGHFVGATQLGYYSLAYNLMMFPVQRFTQVLVEVLFPALSRLQDDTEKLARSWFRAARMITAITAPLMFGLIVLTEPFVRCVYGETWMPTVPLLRILAVLGIVQSLGILDTTVLISLGQSKLQLKLVAVSVSVSLVCFTIGLSWGSVGVAACFLAGSLATSTFFLQKTLSFLKLKYLAYVRNLIGVLSAAAGMGLTVFLTQLWLHVHSAPDLLLMILYGVLVYLFLLCWTDRSILAEFIGVLPDNLSHRLKKLTVLLT
jgi:O-antigen/teichoic acid export membrane protein